MVNDSGAEWGDEWVDRLARMFREHPAWVAAARHLGAGASSTVYFTHRSGEAFRLEQQAGETWLVPGAAPDPDLVFRFSPDSIEALERVEGVEAGEGVERTEGGIGDFAVALLSQVIEGEVALRIRADFPRLLRRGYVKLLLAAGPSVLAFGATHGIVTIGALRRLIASVRSEDPANWEPGEAAR